MEQRVSVVTLGVRDLARATAFYTALGWVQGPPFDADVSFFQCGGMVFGLWDRGSLAEDTNVEDSGGWGGVTLAHNVASPGQVDAVLVQAKQAGATILKEAAPTFYGGYAGFFLDPEGHAWEIAHNPGWTLDTEGSVYLAKE